MVRGPRGRAQGRPETLGQSGSRGSRRWRGRLLEGAPTDAPPLPGPVIDAYVRLAPRSPLFMEWAAYTATENTLGGLERDMGDHGVERAVVLGHWIPDEGEREAPFRNQSDNDLLTLLDAADQAGRDRVRVLLGVHIGRGAPGTSASWTSNGPAAAWRA